MNTDSGLSLSEQLIKLIRSKSVNAGDRFVMAEFCLDAIANMLAGFNSDAGRRFIAWAHPRGFLADSGNSHFDAGRQAFVLGCLTHILEMDDLHRGSITHPGCVVVPAVFALASDPKQGTTSGNYALDATLHGFEAMARIGQAVGRQHYMVWHNTATCGPFGSCLAAAHMLQLDDFQTTHAIGNAGTQAAGLWEFLQTGAMSKHIHAGRGAEAGVVSAELAQHGITGAPTILEGEKAFFKAMCPDGNLSKILEDPQGQWHVHQTSIKPWPSCRHTHPAIKIAIEAAKELKQRGLAPTNIQHVLVDIYEAAINLCDRVSPNSVYEAKFSLQHCVAAGLTFEAVDFSSFNEEHRHLCSGLARRISLANHQEFEAAYPKAWGSRLSITLHNGDKIKVETKSALGDPELPLSQQGMIDKAAMLLHHAGIDDPDRLIDGVLSMSENGSVPTLPVEECVRKNLHS